MTLSRLPLAATALLAGSLTLAGCELAPKVSQQNGYRGTGMDQIRIAESEIRDDVPPPPYELPPPGGQTAGEFYENVQVLGNVSVDEFNYLMAALTEWVAPEEGCNYCHNPANMASDEVYTKTVARSMIQMTQAANANWTDHVGNTGVTCWTCHRGNNIPEAHWSLPADVASRSIIGNRSGQNEPTSNTAWSSLPQGAVARYLLGEVEPEDIRVASRTMHPTPANTRTTMGTEPTYALMMHMSDSLGVNCTYCHNSQSFSDWNISTPPRQTAWHGIRMVRNLNGGYITPLQPIFPENRLGPAGDPFKVNCTTCHQGQNLPLGGVPMVQDYPSLQMAPLAWDPAAAVQGDTGMAADDEDGLVESTQ
ncbi:photosynthetic reaction center cytochrome PufC [Aurantiacibacter poecillastricola]|uniref:photosynthetic reaction center cytochrome PufC n=1 Tax=Aurantiacibacter poecillastricola TaxID=3064385 RepID=UPI00273FBD05|nr:photosynthetic reaction center cytochrome PufC [Aurantiacibacter sp. 219JJ12-13]MDP5260384.1 photosynthetic reaction center cytochrome PufC [Aurantiacibacter sp. 219JJ12-13]